MKSEKKNKPLMKTRTSFVSNSSSSSFLVLAHGKDDFRCFDRFKGYECFISDYERKVKSDNPLDAVMSFLKRIIREEIHDTEYKIEQDLLHPGSNYSGWSCTLADVVDRCEEFHGIPEPKELYAKLVEANNRLYDYREKVWKELDSPENRERQFKYNDREITELNEMAENETKAICEDPLLKEYAEQIVGALPQSCLLEYEDAYDSGSYMEHHFMPFMSQNPETDSGFSIFSVSNH